MAIFEYGELLEIGHVDWTIFCKFLFSLSSILSSKLTMGICTKFVAVSKVWFEPSIPSYENWSQNLAYFDHWASKMTFSEKMMKVCASKQI